MLLRLLLNFVSGSRLKLKYISLIVDIRSSVTYIHACAALVALRTHQQNKSFASKVKFRQASTVGFLKLTKLLRLMKQKSQLLVVFLTKVNLLYSLYLKQNCLQKTLIRTLTLMTQVISLPAFPSRNNVKLHNISVTPKLIKNVITNLELSKASDPDCIPVVVLRN